MLHTTIKADGDDLLALAHEIIAHGASKALGDKMADEQAWLDAAEWYVETDGTDTDLATMYDEWQAWEAYGEYAYETHFRAEPMDFDAWLATASESTVPMVSL